MDRIRPCKAITTAVGLVLLIPALLYLRLPARVERTGVDRELLEKQDPRLERELQAHRPRGYYILVDTAANKLYLKRGNTLLLEAVCSTGSGRKLVAGDKSWTFETPRGEFRILSKIADPIWRKPDWAFLEEGEPIPRKESERYERDVLGDYALAFGNGYFIHGTLYTRLLGRNVTHGCIRLGSQDLAFLIRTAPLGTRLYIY